jgi:hypothetical protein
MQIQIPIIATLLYNVLECTGWSAKSPDFAVKVRDFEPGNNDTRVILARSQECQIEPML